MTSIGKCPYEFWETFTVKDLRSGHVKYSKLALKRLRDIGVEDLDVEHYAKIRIVPGITTHTAVVTVALLPYGEVEYIDTIAIDEQSWIKLLSAVLAYITSVFGWDFGEKVGRKHSGGMADWIRSVAATQGEAGRSTRK